MRGEEVDLADLVVRPVEPDEREGRRRYMARYNYLGYRVMVGEHLMYAAFLYGELVALLGLGRAARARPRPLHRLGRGDEAPPAVPRGQQRAVSDPAVGDGCVTWRRRCWAPRCGG